MTFRVEPENLTGYAKLVSHASDDLNAGIKHLTRYSQIDDSIGDLWQAIFGDHNQRVATAKNALSKLKEALDRSSQELDNSARYYRETDRSEAARIDATYPDTGSYRYAYLYDGDEDGNTRDFSDRVSAVGNLKPPSSESYIQEHIGEFQFASAQKTFGTMMDFGSPSAIVAEFIKGATGVDIFAIATKWLTGDWESYTQCADIWDSLARLCDDISTNITYGNNALDETWNGEAANAAWNYFENLAKTLQIAKESFESQRDNYMAAARTVFSLSETVKGGVADICDWAASAVILSAATGAAATTGVGVFATIAGTAIVAQRIAAIISRYGDMVKQFNLALIGINSIVAAGSGVMAKTDYEIKKLPLPGKSYAHPAV